MRATNTLTLGADRALYVGELPATGWHRHAAPVLLLGLSGHFAVHLASGRVESCHSALIDMGVWHLFDPCGERVALVYLEPDSAEARGLRPWFRQQGGVVFDPATPTRARGCTEARLRSFDLQGLLGQRFETAAELDARVLRSLRHLRMARDGALPRDQVAQAAHLSASRFNHLFREEMGVSFRSYRVWSQVRAAMAGLATQPRLTDAALHGAFSDSAHFSRTFRQTFGMTPSSVLKPLREVTLV
ncbi:helix-turn-helix transcriptional regulator [Simplicispira lacusdiani]|uniref:helix-turn-helix transcriptional regulator n=1 Tax=Simplicispira lacusdiani TaxID=2213010 RepID=UPI000E765D95|nr:AraC family transcriptional regulator [Simplicispira lacusdiani]